MKQLRRFLGEGNIEFGEISEITSMGITFFSTPSEVLTESRFKEPEAFFRTLLISDKGLQAETLATTLEALAETLAAMLEVLVESFDWDVILAHNPPGSPVGINIVT